MECEGGIFVVSRLPRAVNVVERQRCNCCYRCCPPVPAPLAALGSSVPRAGQQARGPLSVPLVSADSADSIRWWPSSRPYQVDDAGCCVASLVASKPLRAHGLALAGKGLRRDASCPRQPARSAVESRCQSLSRQPATLRSINVQRAELCELNTLSPFNCCHPACIGCTAAKTSCSLHAGGARQRQWQLDTPCRAACAPFSDSGRTLCSHIFS